MLNIISQPLGMSDFNDDIEPPIPLSECFQFCLKPDDADVFLTPGQKPKIVFVIPATCTVPANGTAFKIWGNSFTVNSAQDFTANSFKVNAFGVFTALNLSYMLAANIFFKRAGKVTSFVTVGSNYELTFTWNECREQVNFTGANMDLAVFTTIGGSATPTNGISPVFVESYRLIANTVRFIDQTNEFQELGPLVGLEVEKLCDTTGNTCIDINPDVSFDLYTLLPDLTYDSFIPSIENGRSMMRFYSLQYGWTYRENCIAKSGTIKTADRILVLNAAFDTDDPYQIRRYWYGHPDGFPPDQFVPDFLTTQPKKIKLCKDSYKWLWLLNSFQPDWENYALKARFILYDANGDIITILSHVVNNPITMGSAHYQPVCFNASPRFISDVLLQSLDNVVRYDVQVVGVESTDFDAVLFNASEYLSFEICKDCCDDETDLYFLSPAGGIDTVVCRVDSIETIQDDGQEIFIPISCAANREQKARYGGRTMISERAYQKINLSIQIPPSEDWEKWAKHLRQSPQRWIRVKDESGQYIAKKIIFESGAITQKVSGFGVILEMTGYLPYISTQKNNEQRI